MAPLTFLCDLAACLLTEGDHESNELERPEETVIVVPVSDGLIVQGQKRLTEPRGRFGTEFVAEQGSVREFRKFFHGMGSPIKRPLSRGKSYPLRENLFSR